MDIYGIREQRTASPEEDHPYHGISEHGAHLLIEGMPALVWREVNNECSRCRAEALKVSEKLIKAIRARRRQRAARRGAAAR